MLYGVTENDRGCKLIAASPDFRGYLCSLHRYKNVPFTGSRRAATLYPNGM